MFTVELNQFEVGLAMFWAAERNNRMNSKSVPDLKRATDLSSEQIHFMGVGAELAFCKHYNLYPDFQLDLCKRGDAVMVNGCVIDVKSTRSRPDTCWLTAKEKIKENPADIYVLMSGYPPRFVLVGWASYQELFASPLRNGGYGIPGNNLHPMEELP